MTRPRKACSYPLCHEPQPCPTHTRKAWAGSTRRSRLPGNWQRLRLAVLAAQPICNVCANALSVEVDHIQAGDNHDITNLQGICKPCHKTKTQRETRAR